MFEIFVGIRVYIKLKVFYFVKNKIFIKYNYIRKYYEENSVWYFGDFVLWLKYNKILLEIIFNLSEFVYI